MHSRSVTTWNAKFLAMVFTPLLFVVGWSHAIADESVTVSGEYLARLRTSSEFVAVPGLSEMVKKLNADQTLGLIVRYPGGETGQIWGGRIESWLISHGLSSRRISLEVGTSRDDGVEILLSTVQ